MHKPSPFLPVSSLERENPLTRDFTIFRVTIIFFIILHSPVNPLSPFLYTRTTPSADFFSPNVSTVNGGVHGHGAIVFPSPYIPKVERGALPRQALSDAMTWSVVRVRMHVHKIYVIKYCFLILVVAMSSCCCRCNGRNCACVKAGRTWTRIQVPELSTAVIYIDFEWSDIQFDDN